MLAGLLMAFGWTRFVPASALVALGLLAGCGQAEGHRLGGSVEKLDGVRDPDAAGGLRVGSCSSGADLELIDDMEDNNQSISKIAGRSGSWFSFNDLTGSQDPAMGGPTFKMSKTDPSRTGSQFNLRTSGSGFTDWGAGVGFDLATTEAYDASRYTGIAFWARVAPGTGTNLRFNVPDNNTSQYGGVCDLDCQPTVGPMGTNAPTEDGTCAPMRGPCYDDFGVDLLGKLSDGWQLFLFPWDELSAKNWSGKNLPGVSKSALYGVRFQANGPAAGQPPLTFDFSIDDVSLLCH